MIYVGDKVLFSEVKNFGRKKRKIIVKRKGIIVAVNGDTVIINRSYVLKTKGHQRKQYKKNVCSFHNRNLNEIELVEDE